MIRSAAAVYLRVIDAISSPDRFISCLLRAASLTRRHSRCSALAHVASTLVATVLLLLPACAFPQSDFGTQALGVASNPQNVTVNLSAPGIVASVQVLTAGAPGLDFVPAGASTCVSASFPGNCTVSVTFTPTAPGLRVGAIVLMDADQQTVLGTAFIHGIGSGGLGVLIPGNIVPFAGDGEG